MRQAYKNFVTLMVGLALGFALSQLFDRQQLSESQPGDQVQSQDQPGKVLYWVAPMDPNYRRDKPGKSPMGMDLEPVYADPLQTSAIDEVKGLVKISPEVVNNLGVRSVKAALRPLHSHLSTVGYVKYDEDKLVHIHPRVEGWVEKLHVKSAGDPVVAGQPLYELYSPALVNAQEELLLAIERGNRHLIQAAEERLQALQLPAGSISRLKKERKVSQRIVFNSPQDGVVDNLNIREGFFVKPGQTLMSIGQLEQVWVEAEIFERQVSEVKAGLPVTMTLAYLPGKQWLGQVDYVYPTLNEKNRTVKLRLKFDNPDRLLKPNMYAQVRVHVQDQENALLIPREALIRTGSQDRVVVVLGEGRFKSIEVKVGRYDDSFVEILAGLSEGDEVVSSAQFLIDSESSKTSDFKRMSNPESEQKPTSTSHSSATVDGVVNSIDRQTRRLNISRGAIEKWGRGPATLDFEAASKLDLSDLLEGSAVRFTFHRQGDAFLITEIQPLAHASYQ